jgi:hypothetical protein
VVKHEEIYMTSQRQINDWLNHPEKYDYQTDDVFANFMAWIILVAEMNPGLDEKGNPIPKSNDPDSMKTPTRQQVAEKLDEIRGRRH